MYCCIEIALGAESLEVRACQSRHSQPIAGRCGAPVKRHGSFWITIDAATAPVVVAENCLLIGQPPPWRDGDPALARTVTDGFKWLYPDDSET